MDKKFLKRFLNTFFMKLKIWVQLHGKMHMHYQYVKYML